MPEPEQEPSRSPNQAFKPVSATILPAILGVILPDQRDLCGAEGISATSSCATSGDALRAIPVAALVFSFVWDDRFHKAFILTFYDRLGTIYAGHKGVSYGRRVRLVLRLCNSRVTWASPAGVSNAAVQYPALRTGD